MDKKAMQQLIQEALSQKLGYGFRISIHKILKTNQKLDALAILQDGKDIAPTIYLEPFYEELEKGASAGDVADRIIQLHLRAGEEIQGFDATPIADFGYVKSRLFVQLVNRHFNEELLQGVPHSLFLDDLAVLVRCLVSMTSEENASFLVQDGHLALWKTDRESLLSTAIRNTREMFGVSIRDMDAVLGEMAGCPHMDCSPHLLWVMATNGDSSAPPRHCLRMY